MDIPKIFIINQIYLAKAMGVTAQWLSHSKNHFSFSDERVAQLEAITAIPQIYWVNPNRKKLLKQKLTEFFAKERERYKASLTG